MKMPTFDDLEYKCLSWAKSLYLLNPKIQKLNVIWIRPEDHTLLDKNAFNTAWVLDRHGNVVEIAEGEKVLCPMCDSSNMDLVNQHFRQIEMFLLAHEECVDAFLICQNNGGEYRIGFCVIDRRR
jgi:hypothetical protein